MNLIIGSHVGYSSKTGLLGSVNEAISYNASTFMFYTGSAQSTSRSEIDDELTYEAFKLMLDNGINSDNVIIHAPYILNLANKKEEDKYNFYINFFSEELRRVKRLGFNKIVLHPGFATNCDKETAIKNIAEALNIVFNETSDTIVLLEYMAGKGSEVGSSIDELKGILDLINDKSRIGICLDTCHLNDSGIDLNKFDEFLDEFDKLIGLNYLKCIHVNDSMNPISSHKDRHANIGYGTIGFDTLINIVYNKRLEGLPFILETPYINRNESNEYAPYKMEIESIRNKKYVDFISKNNL